MTLRQRFACHAPTREIDSIIGETRSDAADFLGIPFSEYDGRVHDLRAVSKARYLWADAMIEEGNRTTAAKDA